MFSCTRSYFFYVSEALFITSVVAPRANNLFWICDNWKKNSIFANYLSLKLFTMKSIAILTGGGPAPGMNTVVASVAKTFLRDGFRVIGLHGGYSALY